MICPHPVQKTPFPRLPTEPILNGIFPCYVIVLPSPLSTLGNASLLIFFFSNCFYLFQIELNLTLLSYDDAQKFGKLPCYSAISPNCIGLLVIYVKILLVSAMKWSS